MKKAKLGDKVKFHYVGTMLDGSVFESTYDKEPFVAILGETKIIPGLQKMIIGMQENEEKKETISPAEGYGIYKPKLLAVLNKSEFPKNSIPVVGWLMKIGDISVTVKKIEGDEVTLDGNHPLAGLDSIFEVKILEIKSP